MFSCDSHFRMQEFQPRLVDDELLVFVRDNKECVDHCMVARRSVTRPASTPTDCACTASSPMDASISDATCCTSVCTATLFEHVPKWLIMLHMEQHMVEGHAARLSFFPSQKLKNRSHTPGIHNEVNI